MLGISRLEKFSSFWPPDMSIPDPTPVSRVYSSPEHPSTFSALVYFPYFLFKNRLYDIQYILASYYETIMTINYNHLDGYF